MTLVHVKRHSKYKTAKLWYKSCLTVFFFFNKYLTLYEYLFTVSNSSITKYVHNWFRLRELRDKFSRVNPTT